MLDRSNRIHAHHTTSAADLLKETMADFKITQTDLAKRLNISQKTVSDILNRKTFVNEITALKLQEVLGISSSLLLNLDINFNLEKATKEINSEKHEQNTNSLFLKPFGFVSSYGK
jgi:antitoxin HigA-1